MFTFQSSLGIQEVQFMQMLTWSAYCNFTYFVMILENK